MAEVVGPFTKFEIADLQKEAERCQFQRGAQGVWARKVLRLIATYEAPSPAACHLTHDLPRSPEARTRP